MKGLLQNSPNEKNAAHPNSMGCTASGVWFDSIILLFCRQFQKFLVRLDALGHKFAIPEQCVCCDRCRHILSRLFLGDVDGFERDPMFLCSLPDGKVGGIFLQIGGSSVSVCKKDFVF